jgi:hypothetical protein
MRGLAIVATLALALGLCACANNTPNTVTNTSTSGNWEAQLISPTGGQASLLNFVVGFNVTNNGPLNITGFAFFNQGACFANGLNAETVTGTASYTTGPTGQVTGTLSLKITSAANGSVLTLTSNPDGLTGTSNGTTTTTGTLSNGVAVGTWTLVPGGTANSNGCNAVNSPDATFIMCQNASSCTTTAAITREPKRQFAGNVENRSAKSLALFEPLLSLPRLTAIQ